MALPLAIAHLSIDTAVARVTAYMLQIQITVSVTELSVRAADTSAGLDSHSQRSTVLSRQGLHRVREDCARARYTYSLHRHERRVPSELSAQSAD